MKHFRFRQTIVMSVTCVSFLVGLAGARRLSFSGLWVLVLVWLLVLAAYSRRDCLTLGILCLAAGLLGLARGHTFMQHLAEYQAFFKHPIVLRATADTDAIYGNNSQLSFDASGLTIAENQKRITGKIKVEGMGIPMVYRGDQLQISGVLSPTKGAAQAKMSFAKLQLIAPGDSWLDKMRRRFIAGLLSVVPEPEASFGGGLLLGQRSTIPKEINDQLSITGLTHLVAVSGYNLTIIIMAVRKLLQKGSKFQIAIGASLLMLVFVLLTGLSASIVRASIVSSLSLVAWYYGRQFKPLLLILITAVATTTWNPFYLWSDIGWYLSFLAFFGVLVIAPVASRTISRGKQPKLVGGLLAETISAQLMTLPIIMYIFGRVSNISLLANVMVVPLVPLAMLLTLTSGLAGMTLPVVAGWLAWPSKLLLTYMLDITGLFSQVPHAAFEHKIDLVTMILAYFVIVVVTCILQKIHTRKTS